MTVFFQHLHQNLKGTIKMVCLSVCVCVYTKCFKVTKAMCNHIYDGAWTVSSHLA